MLGSNTRKHLRSIWDKSNEQKTRINVCKCDSLKSLKSTFFEKNSSQYFSRPFQYHFIQNFFICWFNLWSKYYSRFPKLHFFRIFLAHCAICRRNIYQVNMLQITSADHSVSFLAEKVSFRAELKIQYFLHHFFLLKMFQYWMKMSISFR